MRDKVDFLIGLAIGISLVNVIYQIVIHTWGC